MKTLISVLFALTPAIPARAQSINVDFEPTNTPFGKPTPNYGASALAAGAWNSVSALNASGLRRWDGTVTPVSLTINGATPGCGVSFDEFDAVNTPSTSGQAESLLDDRYNPGASVGVTCVFQGLLPGDYVVDTIVPERTCLPTSGAGIRVGVLGSSDPPAVVAGTWSGAFVEGQNFARHAVTVANGTITITLDMVAFTDYIEVAGIQLHHGEQQLPGTPICFGDGIAAACPCSNSGPEGHGCQNSASTGGAVLFATGTTEPDTVVLHSFNELPSALSIFLQGNASIAPVVYGDGLRCTGGTLRRLYTKSASGGEASAPGLGDPPITVRSAQLGVPIPADGRRYYQVYYRDANAGYCAAPQGSTFNVSSAVRINW